MNPVLLFWTILKASLLSTGGYGSLPSVHRDLTEHAWAREDVFVEALAVGQVSPGPNGLWVTSLGFILDGWRGAILATLAVALPPFLLLAVDRIYQRVRHLDAVEGCMRGLSLAVIGVVAVTLTGFMQSAGWSPRTVGVALAAAFLGTWRRMPVALVILLAGIVGVIWH